MPIETSIELVVNENLQHQMVAGLFVALLTIAYVISKASKNQDPDKNEQEEAKRNAAKAKHQGWQTLDWQM